MNLEKLLAKNMIRFGTKNLTEQGDKTGTTLAVPAGSREIKPYKVVQDDTLWSIATNWIRKYALIDAPSDDQIKSFVKQIVKNTNSLSNFKGLDLPGADTQIKDPNLIKPGMIFYLPIDKNEIL